MYSQFMMHCQKNINLLKWTHERTSVLRLYVHCRSC